MLDAAWNAGRQRRGTLLQSSTFADGRLLDASSFTACRPGARDAAEGGAEGPSDTGGDTGDSARSSAETRGAEEVPSSSNVLGVGELVNAQNGPVKGHT